MDSFEDKAQEVTVLGSVTAILGIPMPYVAFTLVIAFPLTFMVWWVLGLVFATLALFGLYHIHQADPQAVDVWLERMRSQVNIWRAGRKTDATRLSPGRAAAGGNPRPPGLRCLLQHRHRRRDPASLRR